MCQRDCNQDCKQETTSKTKDWATRTPSKIGVVSGNLEG